MDFAKAKMKTLTMPTFEIDWNQVMIDHAKLGIDCPTNPVRRGHARDDVVAEICTSAIKNIGFLYNEVYHETRPDRYALKYSRHRKVLTLYNIEVYIDEKMLLRPSKPRKLKIYLKRNNLKRNHNINLENARPMR